MSNPGTFSGDLDLPFRQGSFGFSEPSFGRPDLNAGMSFGLAILSDLEAFLFIRAAQGDRRSNVMFAPKVTLFNGMFGNVTSGTRRPFVVSLIPVASAFSVGFQPIIQTIQEGSSLTVRAVISADRRYVRLAVLPTFQNITAVFTFSFIGASTGAAGLSGGLTGGTAGGTTGGTGGGTGGGTAGTTGGTAGTAGSGGVSGAQVTVQQPVVDVVTVDTVVSVPDGGTVLLGGVKQIREQRNMAGVPILNKIPYISRLFRNTGVGRETSSLMMMVTPRIIIQEEEEELLGIPN
jgi:type II secretory pathway component GspD/PulD (secretin)